MPPSARNFRYGLLGIPLAFVGLPLYVHIPQFYSDLFHINLATLGAILLSLRLLDAISDPVIGYLSDRWLQNFGKLLIGAGSLLILAYIALFNPPLSFAHPLIWLTVNLGIVYVSFSALMINYYALGSRLAPQYHEQTRLAVCREGSMLIGVLLASLLPAFLQKYMSVQNAYGYFGAALAPIFIVCAQRCYSLRPPVVSPQKKHALKLSFRQRPEVLWVLALAFFNFIPSAITSTLFLFFTRDVLGAEKSSGPLLALYFLSAACGMPIWTWCSKKFGKRQTLLIAIVLAITCFIWSSTLHEGQVIYFAVICFLSGLTFGADVVMVPSLLSDTLANTHQSSATVFGFWNFVNKLTMGLAAGIVLPILSFVGYRSGVPNSPHILHVVALCYAILPCFFKGCAFILLYFSPIDQEMRHGR